MGEIVFKQQEKDSICIKKTINGSVILKFIPKRKNENRIKKAAKEAAEGIALGLMFAGMVFATVEIRAALPKPELPVEYITYCEDIGQTYNICPELLQAVIEQESGGDPDAIGNYGEIGLMQIYPVFHQERMWAMGIYNLTNPKDNIKVGADYLAELFREYGDIGTVLMAYNGVRDAEQRGSQGDYTEYAEKIMKRAEQLERLHEK